MAPVKPIKTTNINDKAKADENTAKPADTATKPAHEMPAVESPNPTQGEANKIAQEAQPSVAAPAAASEQPNPSSDEPATKPAKKAKTGDGSVPDPLPPYPSQADLDAIKEGRDLSGSDTLGYKTR